MNWKQWLSFVGQHALQGAIVAGAGLATAGHTPFTTEGLTIMAGAALVSAGNHLRARPATTEH